MSEYTECLELKNIKYKSMLLNGINSDISISDNVNNFSSEIELILERERNFNLKESWGKLDKTIKLHKLYDYADSLSIKDSLSSSNLILLKQFLYNCLDFKKLGRVKDVTYNVETGKIDNIPLLMLNEATKKYCLKRCDKRVSTLKSLGLGSNKTRRKVDKIDSSIKNNQ